MYLERKEENLRDSGQQNAVTWCPHHRAKGYDIFHADFETTATKYCENILASS
jgi:hypothetical protein